MTSFPTPPEVIWPLHLPDALDPNNIRVQLLILFYVTIYALVVSVVYLVLTWRNALKEGGLKSWWWFFRLVKRPGGTYLVINPKIIAAFHPFILLPLVIGRLVIEYRYYCQTPTGSPRFLSIVDDVFSLVLFMIAWMAAWAMTHAFMIVCESEGRGKLVRFYKPLVGNCVCVLVGIGGASTILAILLRCDKEQANIINLLRQLARLAPTETKRAEELSSTIVKHQLHFDILERTGDIVWVVLGFFTVLLLISCFAVAWRVRKHLFEQKEALPSRFGFTTTPSVVPVAISTANVSASRMVEQTSQEDPKESEGPDGGGEQHIKFALEAGPQVKNLPPPTITINTSRSARREREEALRRTARGTAFFGLVASVAIGGMASTYVYAATRPHGAGGTARERDGDVAHTWLYVTGTALLQTAFVASLVIRSIRSRRRLRSVAAVKVKDKAGEV